MEGVKYLEFIGGCAVTKLRRDERLWLSVAVRGLPALASIINIVVYPKAILRKLTIEVSDSLLIGLRIQQIKGWDSLIKILRLHILLSFTLTIEWQAR